MSPKSRLVLALILLLGAFLRLFRLNGYGLWSDEFVTLMIVSKQSYDELIRTCFDIPQPMPPLYFALNKLVFDCFQPGEHALRLLSALSSLITGWVMFSLGRSLFSVEAGLYSSLLFAVNSTQIVYAQNARPYAFCLLLSALSMLYFVLWLREPVRRFRVGYSVSTLLLFYSHYIFFPLLLIQNLYFLWTRRGGAMRPVLRASEALGPQAPRHEGLSLPAASGESGRARKLWKSWLSMQATVAILLAPLYPQLWHIIHARQSLNWERKYPAVKDLLMFWHAKALLWSCVVCLLVAVVWWVTKRLTHVIRALDADGSGQPAVSLLGIPVRRGIASCLLTFRRARRGAQNGRGPSRLSGLARGNLVLAGLWYLVPLLLFFLFARATGINLFVERYLILASLPTFLLLPGLSFSWLPNWIARSLLLAYLSLYICFVPADYFAKKGRFSQGVPGGNEWRESLGQLNGEEFKAPLFLFQSPFIESNQLQYTNDPELFDYLSTPLRSFYVRDRQRPFVLLPVHWWIEDPVHQAFKHEIARLLMTQPEFVLLSTQEFWVHFEPWLRREFSGRLEWRVVRSFHSSGALRVKRIRCIRPSVTPS